MNLVERKRLARDLSGPAASVLMALLLADRPLTAVSLADDWVNQSVPTVQAGLNRLAEYGLVNNWGKFEGWGVNLKQLALWQGHSGVLLAEEGNQSQAHPRLTMPTTTADLSPHDAAAVDNFSPEDEKTKNFSFRPSDPDPDLTDLIQSSNPDFENLDLSDLRALIENLGIRSPADKRLEKAGVDVTVLLGWYLWAACQSWVSSAVGWAIKCVLNPREELAGDWLALAVWWLGLDEETAVAVLAAFDGALMVRSEAAASSLLWSCDIEIDSAVCHCLTVLWLGKSLGGLRKARGL